MLKHTHFLIREGRIISKTLLGEVLVRYSVNKQNVTAMLDY